MSRTNRFRRDRSHMADEPGANTSSDEIKERIGKAIAARMEALIGTGTPNTPEFLREAIRAVQEIVNEESPPIPFGVHLDMITNPNCVKIVFTP